MSQYPTMTAMDESTYENEVLRREAKDWVVHVATGAVTKSDLRALEQWRTRSQKHAQAYAQACELWDALGSPLKTSALMGARSAGRTGLSALVGRRAFFGGALAASAAAAVMIARPPFALWPSLTDLAADYHTGAGEQRRIALTQHASIEMNTRTSLNIGRTEGDADSIELIAGEASVTAGLQPLTVLVSEGRISATEAQFTVRCVGPEVRVTCLGGMIDVAYRGQTVAVRSRQQVTYNGSGLGPAMQIDPDVAAAWRNGLLVFDDERLSNVIDEVNRYRSARIILANAELGERRITSRFKIARLDAVLTQFQEVFGAKVTPLPGGFVLLS